MRTKNLDIYGHGPIPWSRVHELLEGTTKVVGQPPSSWFLTTASTDGQPHAAGIGALWFDDKLWIVSGPKTKKSRNMAANPRVVLSVSLKGLDLVVEGTAARVTDAKTLERFSPWPVSDEGGLRRLAE